tara:strand:+ start:809 stop:1795 length:987 start_codon:yes stop_codon:yes gene_type:complete
LKQYFPELRDQFRSLAEAAAGVRVCVIGHARPDGDCVGSQIAAQKLLAHFGLESFMANADCVPNSLLYLEGSELISIFDRQMMNDTALLYVDCADEGRVGPKTSIALQGFRRIGNVDHHISNTGFAEFNVVDQGASATCEILAGIAFDLQVTITPDLAQALYTGIMTDTGRFGFAATSSRVFDLCANLVDCGASPQAAAENLYENVSLARLKLLERFLGTLEYACDGKVCIGELKQRDFLETGTSYLDTEGFVDYARSVSDVAVGVLLEERKTTTKGSLRAERKEIRVDQVAAQFGGGGHACAAAMSSAMSLEELRNGLIESLRPRVS